MIYNKIVKADNRVDHRIIAYMSDTRLYTIYSVRTLKTNRAVHKIDYRLELINKAIEQGLFTEVKK